MGGRRKRKAPEQSPDTWTNTPRSALELLASLLGGSTYRVPIEKKDSKPSLTISDIAGAAGYMPDKVNRDVAMAVALRSDHRTLRMVAEFAERKVVESIERQRPSPLDLTRDMDRFRLRLVTYHALAELVHPEQRRPFHALAREAKMRKARYITVHRCVTAVLQDALNTGSTEFASALWGSR